MNVNLNLYARDGRISEYRWWQFWEEIRGLGGMRSPIPKD